MLAGYNTITIAADVAILTVVDVVVHIHVA